MSADDAAPGRGLIVVSVMLATVMQALDTTITNVALPEMQGTFSATEDQIAWVLTSYIVAAAIATPPTGFLAARLGRRRLFLLAVSGFTVTSMLCGIAATLDQMVAFRLMQGVFGAGLVPLSQAVLLDTFPRERHGQAMAMWGVGVMVGPILGPTLGGWLADAYNWHWVFYINLPFGLLALVGIAAVVPETERDRERPFDWMGFVMLSVAVGALQLVLDRGQSKDWFSSTEIVGEAVVAGLFLYLFIVHVLTAERPFIEPAIFRDRNLCAGLVLIFLVGIILLATLALLPPFLQGILGYPVLTTGLVLAPRGVGTMIGMLIVGRLVARTDPRALMVVGLLLVALSLWEMAGFTPAVDEMLVLETGLLQGLGLGLVFVPLSTMTFATLAPHRRNEATALFSLMRNVGSSMGISAMVTLLARNTQAVHSVLVEQITPFNPLARAPLVPAPWNPAHLAGLAALDHEITRQAATIAYLSDFRLMALVALGAIPLLLLLKRPGRYPALPAAAPSR